MPGNAETVPSERRSPLNYSGAAEYLNTSVRHVRALKAAHKIPSVKVGALVRFMPDDLDAFIEANRERVD